MQRLRNEQRLGVPRHLAHRGQVSGFGIDQRGLVKPRGQRRPALHEHGIVVLAGIDRAREGEERRCHVGGRPFRGIHCGLDGGEFRRRRFVLVRRHHLGELVCLPQIEDRHTQRVEHAGSPHHECPAQRDNAQHVVQVQPLDPRVAVLAHSAEVEPAHEGCVDHHAGDECRHEQKAHQPEKQFARQACEHIHMQAEDDVHHVVAVIGRVQHPGGAAVDHRIVIVRRSRGFSDRDIGDARFLMIENEILRHGAGILCHARRHHAVQVDEGRVGRHRGRFGRIAQRMIDLFMEDQRQAGDAQQQQKRRADQAGPFVDQIPVADLCRLSRDSIAKGGAHSDHSSEMVALRGAPGWT